MNLTRPVIGKEIKSTIKNLPTMKSPGPEDLLVDSTQIFKESVPTLHKLFQKSEKEASLPILLCEASLTPI